MQLFSLLFMISLCFHGCIEPFDAEFGDFENVLVVEATITNEMKQQQVFLTRTFEFEADGSSAESNADVKVVSGGVTFNFEETDPGVYVSTQAFAAQTNTAYELRVDTQNGRSYSSDETMLTPITQIDEVRAERIINDDGKDGIAIFVDSFDPKGNSLNYRYTYEETYKIISPNWTGQDLAGDEEGSCELFIVPKEREEQVCYTTDFSNGLVLTNTNGLEEDRVNDFMVRFINRNNYIISHRYSILVKQHVQSNASYAFYEKLKEFSSSESLFSETQPGFLEGNISSEQDKEEKVLGFFDVASVSERRIFFNYTDLYPDEPLPPYVDPCSESAPPLADIGGCVLRPIIDSGLARFTRENFTPGNGEGPFFIVPRVCGDCTVLGRVEIPSFWVE